MARRKKSQHRKGEDAIQNVETNVEAFMQACLSEIEEQKKLGITLKPKGSRSDIETAPLTRSSGKTRNASENIPQNAGYSHDHVKADAITEKTSDSEPNNDEPSARHNGSSESAELLNDLEALCTEDEILILRECGAFGDVELSVTAEGDKNIQKRPISQITTPFPMYRAPVPPVPLYGDHPNTTGSEALGRELRYLATVMQPAEMRWLVSELAFDMLEQSPVTHTDISDAVIASISQSTAQKVTFMADAQYKYTTAQFLQVYMKMRHVVLENKIMLASAKADAMLLANSGLNIPDLIAEDIKTPVSAVSALRNIMISEKNVL